MNMKEYLPIKVAGSLQVLYKNTIIKNDETYLKRGIVGSESFVLISGSFTSKKWKRFPSHEMNDYFYMSDNYWDAVML